MIKLTLARRSTFYHPTAAFRAERHQQPLQIRQLLPLLHPASSQACMRPQVAAPTVVKRPAHPVSRPTLSTATVVKQMLPSVEQSDPMRRLRHEKKEEKPGNF